MIIGIIGCGGVAQAHVHALSQIESVTELAFYDINDYNMCQLSELTTRPVKFCTTLAELAQKSDGFIICTPNNLHVSLAEEVLKHKQIPFVCEKPLSTHLASARRLAELAPCNSIVSFNYRYNRIIQNLVQVKNDRELGKLHFFSAEFNKNSALTRNHLTWRDSAQQSKSSGALGDLSCHLLDLFCLLSDDTINTNNLRIAKGTRVGTKDDGLVEVDDNGYIFGHACGGAYFRIKASKSDEADKLGLHFNLVFDRGEIRYSTQNKNRLFLTLFNQIGVEDVTFSDAKILSDPPRELPYWSDSFYHLLQDWCLALKGKPHTVSLPTLSAGLHIQEIMEAF
ncbi:Gfo/Idh/MocA family protein [Photorhabdus viridis]|uniref:Gfo/Idh/MocA family protein n=1 Tax=Photorhabdus viridis TaxID=3163327 RepID=UPI003306BF49